MIDKVIAIVCAVVAIAAWVCADQFGKQAKKALDALTLSEQKLQQAQAQEKEATERLRSLEPEGELTQEEVDRLREDVKKQERKQDEEEKAASEEVDSKEAMVRKLEEQAEECQTKVQNLEGLVNEQEAEVRGLEERVKERQAEVRELEERVDRMARVAANTVSSAAAPVRVVSYPAAVGDRSDLQPMINRMAALRCREATSALYQKRLLTLLPMIRDGAPVDLTLPETKGNTALHYSCGIGSWSITKWLVEHGANVNAVTNKGKTPLDCVGADNAQRIRNLLISRGAVHSR